MDQRWKTKSAKAPLLPLIYLLDVGSVRTATRSMAKSCVLVCAFKGLQSEIAEVATVPGKVTPSQPSLGPVVSMFSRLLGGCRLMGVWA